MIPTAVEKPFAPAAARNADAILSVLQSAFAGVGSVLEIGSGTGQHAVHFARAMPWLRWQCSDVPAHLPGIQASLDEAALPNTPPALALDVREAWPDLQVDAVFSANTLHIMHPEGVEACLMGMAQVLAPEAVVAIYGPFKKDGAHTAQSNAAFEQHLQAEDPGRGIRDMADLDAVLARHSLERSDTVAMPANNHCLIWRRRQR